MRRRTFIGSIAATLAAFVLPIPVIGKLFQPVAGDWVKIEDYVDNYLCQARYRVWSNGGIDVDYWRILQDRGCGSRKPTARLPRFIYSDTECKFISGHTWWEDNLLGVNDIEKWRVAPNGSRNFGPAELQHWFRSTKKRTGGNGIGRNG
jgi:hypothetical protein